MKLTKIKLDAFKGVTGEFTLSPVTLICGENFSGKTAILDAITVSLLGRHPRVGASNEKLARFGDNAQVTLNFDTGAESRLSIVTVDGKRSVATAPGVTVPPVLLDVREYFGKTGADRVRYVFDCIPSPMFNAQAIVSGIENVDVLPTDLSRPLAVEASKLGASLLKNGAAGLDQLSERLKASKKTADADCKSQSALMLTLRSNEIVPDVSAQLESAMAEFASVCSIVTEHQKWVKDDVCPTCGKKLRVTLKAAVKPTVEEVAASEERLRKARVLVEALREQQAKFKALADQRQRRNLTENNLLVSTAASGVYKAALEIVVEAQRTVCASVFNELLAVSRKFTDGILRSPLEYRDGDLGRVEKGQWVSHEVFSGTEQLIAYAGLSVALAQRSPFKLVLLDELGRLDQRNKDTLLARLVELQKERVIDQAIVLDVLPTIQPGVSVVEL